MPLYNFMKLNLDQPSVFFRTIGAGILLLVILNNDYLKKILNTGIPRFLGRISFSMYLLHLLIIYSISSIVFIIFYNIVPYNAASIITFLATLLVVLGVSCVTYRYVDESGIRLSRKIYKLYFSEETNAMNWKDVEGKTISFAQKYIFEIILIEIALLTLTVFSFILKVK